MNNMDVVGEILITQEQINGRVWEISTEIAKNHAENDVILVGILRGSVLWMADIMKNTPLDLTIDFMVCSSYGSSTKSSGVVRINKDLEEDIDGRAVIIVEDIVDSGVTLEYLKKYLANRNPKSVEVCSLLDKPSGRRCDIEADYVGFTVDDRFIVGYGLDFDQRYRQLPYISWIPSE